MRHQEEQTHTMAVLVDKVAHGWRGGLDIGSQFQFSMVTADMIMDMQDHHPSKGTKGNR